MTTEAVFMAIEAEDEALTLHPCQPTPPIVAIDTILGCDGSPAAADTRNPTKTANLRSSTYAKKFTHDEETPPISSSCHGHHATTFGESIGGVFGRPSLA